MRSIFTQPNPMNENKDNDLDSKPVSMVGRIIYKLKIFARRYYKYPYPKEKFFQEIAEKTVGDAHGNCSKEVFTKQRIKLLWFYVKSQALLYILMVQTELKNKFLHPGQKAFYAYKFGTDSLHIDAKLEGLKDQFSDHDDILKP
jgi:hypothetical protein